MAGSKTLRDRLLRVYILEGRVPRGATMVGAEGKNFLTLKSLDRRKWHFQTLVWPSAGCRAQSTISQNYGGVTLLHTSPRNVRPRLWYTFLVCMGMIIPLRDFVSQK
jgi:hypothetical protein